MGNCLSLYGPVEAETYVNNCYSIGVCAIRGCRKTMQDRHSICLSLSNHPEYSIFAVFDGFNGDCASQYLSNNLVKRLNELNTLDDDELIIAEINKIDQQFLKLKDENINIRAGSTIVFALVETKLPTLHLNLDLDPFSYSNSEANCSSSSSVTSYSTKTTESSVSMPLQSISSADSTYKARIFWVGDSRAIVLKENGHKFEPLTIDHHCDLPDELIRIKKANAEIINNKIDGICELSRCFGCESMKNNTKLNYNQQKMVCVPQCKHISIESGETLLLFCDGLTAMWDDNQLIKRYNFKRNQHKNEKNALQKSLNYLVEECIDCGSKDNITVISINFQ